MSNKERGSYGNRYYTCNLCIGRLRWLHRRGGDSMNVGDLVKGRLSLGGRIGMIIKVVSDDPIVGEKFLLVQWHGGVRDTLNQRLLEVINASR